MRNVGGEGGLQRDESKGEAEGAHGDWLASIR
jgi:hypothetical protein